MIFLKCEKKWETDDISCLTRKQVLSRCTGFAFKLHIVWWKETEWIPGNSHVLDGITAGPIYNYSLESNSANSGIT